MSEHRRCQTCGRPLLDGVAFYCDAICRALRFEALPEKSSTNTRWRQVATGGQVQFGRSTDGTANVA